MEENKIKKSLTIEPQSNPEDFKEVTITENDIVIFVVQMLPFTLSKENGKFSIKESCKILYPSLFNLAKKQKPKIIWVGMVNYDSYTEEEQKQIKEELLKYNAYPVFPNPETSKNFDKYYNSVISPIFHNFSTYRNNSELKDINLHQAYRNINNEFVANIIPLYNKNPNAIVMFNDPYFLLAPKIMLESKIKSIHMGYFFHTPFSSYEIYRVLPQAQEFMDSLLCCDIVSFQVYEYARHFFTCCHRLLELEAESRQDGTIGIIYKGRDVSIRVGHVGISKEYINDIGKTEEFKRELESFKVLKKNRIVMASVDKLAPISGIKNKLIAYHDLLRDYPEFIGKLLLIQYCTPGSASKITKETSKEIQEFVNEINKEFPDSIIYSEGSISNEKRNALFTAANILFVTSLRDGFCLLPFEFLLTKTAFRKSNTENNNLPFPGSVIITEFAGCASAMSSICRINPYVISDITYSLLNAIQSQSIIEELGSFEHDVKYIEKHSAEFWFLSLTKDLKRGHNKNESVLYLGAINNKIVKANHSFEFLLPLDLTECYAKSVNRVILLDSEGTIMPIMSELTLQNIDTSVLRQLLKSLCSDEKNSIFVLSGKTKTLIDKWFGDVPKLGLCAEYGYYYKSDIEPDWKIAPIKESESWRAETKKIFLWYKERTDGSDIEIKDGSLAWIYKNCDPEFGNWQAKELEKTLKTVLISHPEVTTVHGRGFVEVKWKALEKGESALSILTQLKKRRGDIDFILSIGDDTSDEPMFKAINELESPDEKNSELKEKNCVVFTCTVGRKPSYAKYYVNSYTDTLRLLEALALCSIKIPRNKSMNKLPSFDTLPKSKREYETKSKTKEDHEMLNSNYTKINS